MLCKDNGSAYAGSGTDRGVTVWETIPSGADQGVWEMSAVNSWPVTVAWTSLHQSSIQPTSNASFLSLPSTTYT